MSADFCIISQFLTNENDCHKETFSSQTGFKSLKSDLTKEEFTVLIWRIGLRQNVSDGLLTISESAQICLHHYHKYIKYFETKQTKCCDPFTVHEKIVSEKKRKLIKIPKGQHSVKLKMAEQLLSENYNVVPGKKLCCNCWEKALSLLNQNVDDNTLKTSTDGCISAESEHSEFDEEDNLDASFAACGISPFKSKGKTKKQKLSHAASKIGQVAKVLEFAFQKKGIDIPSTSNSMPSRSCAAENDIHDLMLNVKKKLENLTKFSDKVQLLTLKPNSWGVEETCNFFNVTKHAVRTASQLKEEKGILAKLTRKTRNDKINEKMIEKVTSFFLEDEVSRQLPGKKDYVSIGYKQHKQKRLLLCNLKELFSLFCEKNPDIKIGLSKFCTLRPKWCKPVGSPGGHSVCVCSVHQNAILACHALNFDYKCLMNKLVCNVSNKLCMIHRCEECPGKNLIEFLNDALAAYDEQDEITVQQWQSTDRTTIVTMVMEISDYVDFLASKIDALTTHSYISKCQAAYLTDIKSHLPLGTCIALADFSENYSMVIQDSVQGWYFSKQQCTIHPVVLYHCLEDGSVATQLFAFFSDDMNHDTGFLYSLQKLLSNYISCNFPQICQIEYFSDGCYGQYKNYKNFLNLTFHKQDFGLDATWNFFATGHGKSPCDGLGGTIKRKLSNESLKRPRANQILSCSEAYEFCQSSMPSIEFFYISKEDLGPVREYLQSRYELGSTVPGTCSFHLFKPVDVGVISYKTTADDANFCGTFYFFNNPTSSKVIQPKMHDYVAVTYDEHLWIGIVENFDQVAEELQVKFMIPHGVRKAYSWPVRDDVCWLPKQDVIKVLSTPQVTSTSGRMFRLDDKDFAALQKLQ